MRKLIIFLSLQFFARSFWTKLRIFSWILLSPSLGLISPVIDVIEWRIFSRDSEFSSWSSLMRGSIPSGFFAEYRGSNLKISWRWAMLIELTQKSIGSVAKAVKKTKKRPSPLWKRMFLYFFQKKLETRSPKIIAKIGKKLCAKSRRKVNPYASS